MIETNDTMWAQLTKTTADKGDINKSCKLNK